ncbi:subtilisin-like protein [Thozetella sp. PMI_491]|nr:subtilisin-like protein [Thozetella sp. PMI_491]
MNQSRPIRRNTGSKTPIAAEPVKKKEDKTKELQYKYVEGSEVGIKDYLKLYYLRERDHDAAVEFLYGSQQDTTPDRQIYFDLFGCGPTLSESRIIRGWNHLDFEDVLQYVAIPQVRVEPDLPVKEMSLLSRNDGVGRCDFTILFNWLKKERLNGARKERRVKKILKVIVDDLQEPSHSDEAIEACLKDLDVEVWDWRRTDICSQVIKEASPNVRVVHLYWSGNNAVLQGWSVGLKDLPCLKQVVLHGQQWVATMDDFADFLVSAERNLRPRGSIKPEVTVALIDDGVDINDEMIESRIIGGRSFCHREENLSQPYYVSGGGHGTAMAGLICRICPNVRLYVLKLDEYVIESGKRQITAKSAAKAIQAAVDKKVDIISMSWTIEKPDTGDKAKEDEITELESAIQLAAKKNILMFCAATDGGPVRDTTYPAASGTKWIFKIGAAEASGTAMKWLGSQDIVDFIMPGHQVVMERQNDPNVKRFTALTGSSVATALAAGLAAVILYCAQITVLLKEPGRRALDTPTYKALKTHEKMVAAFKRIGTTEGSNHKFIQVWELFGKEVDKTRKDLNYQAKDTWIVLVRRLGDSFLQLCES